MSYQRRVLHFGSDPANTPTELSDRAVAGCWFEIHRQGGCGAGELLLRDGFPDRADVDIGDWIGFEHSPGDRWYLGRVEHRQARSPSGVSIRLEGMGVELGEVFPGGFSRDAEGVPPHRYAATDLFPHDPDYLSETVDAVSEPHALVSLLLQQYVVSNTHVTAPAANIEASIPATTLTSLKFRGEESVRAIVKELAVRARGAAWGVDAEGEFFFLRPRTTNLVTLQEGDNLISLDESRDREFLYNRVVLTGGYVYDEPLSSDGRLRGFYRWRGNYIQPASRDLHGERRIRLWIPWIRSEQDSLSFIREFFRIYAQPTTRYLVEFDSPDSLPLPWNGQFTVLDRNGVTLAVAATESVRIQFDHTCTCRAEIGPLDPHTHWPEPPQDERWEIPNQRNPAGGLVTFTEGASSSAEMSSQLTSALSSGVSSDVPSSSASSSDAPSSSSGGATSGLTSSGAGGSSSAQSGSSTQSSSAPATSGTMSDPAPSSSDPPYSTGSSGAPGSSSGTPSSSSV